jgi:hypothetical protein
MHPSNTTILVSHSLNENMIVIYWIRSFSQPNSQPSHEIRKLNYCCLYLQAVTLADVSKPSGQELDRSVFPTSISLHIAAAHAVTLSIKTAPLPTSESYGYQRIGLGATRKGLFSTPHQCMASSSTGALFSIILIQTSTLLVRLERAQTLRSISTNWSKPIPPVVFAGNANIRTVAGPRASSRCCVALKRHPGCNSPNSSCTFARHRNH